MLREHVIYCTSPLIPPGNQTQGARHVARVCQSAHCIVWKRRSVETPCASMTAFVVTLAIVALPLLCVLHCQMPPAPVQDAPRPFPFLCHLVPGFAEISPSSAVDSAGSLSPTIRAVYDCVMASALAVAYLLLALAYDPDGEMPYRFFAFPLPSPPPRT
jgi:hypothetical protein